jgi:hypothetical protein
MPTKQTTNELNTANLIETIWEDCKSTVKENKLVRDGKTVGAISTVKIGEKYATRINIDGVGIFRLSFDEDFEPHLTTLMGSPVGILRDNKEVSTVTIWREKIEDEDLH